MNRRVVLRAMKIGALVLCIGIILGYGYESSTNIRLGPIIEVYTPINGHMATTSAVRIRGKVSNVQELTINGFALSMDKDGNFEDIYIQSPGKNVILIQGKDRFGSEEIVDIQTYYQDTL